MIKSNFLAIGECMVEIAPAHSGLFTMSYAGDTFNTAWYLRQQLSKQTDVGFCTVIGTDKASSGMFDFIAKAGINTDAIHRIPDRTVGLYSIHIDKGERSFSYWRSDSAAKTIANDPQWLARKFDTAQYLYFSGITLAILPDDEQKAFLEALNVARKNGATVIFDTNLRPRLWPDLDSMRKGITAAAKTADIILPSFDDEAEFFGDKTPTDTINRYAKSGAHSIIVKNAADPVWVFQTDTGITQYPITAVAEIVDSTAAGDSFNAGFLAAYIEGESMEAAITRGSALAAHVVTGKGALVEKT